MPHRPPLHALTGLRGVAAVWVVVFHLRPWLAFPGPLDRLAAHGYLAVDVFFALSGFILTYHHLELAPRPGAWLQFWRLRLARIAPLHLAITVGLLMIVAARGWWHLPAFSLDYLPAQLTLSQIWTSGAASSWNTPSWSVSAEWHAYLAFPVLALGVRRIRGPRTAWGLAAVAVAISVVVLAGQRDTNAGVLVLVRVSTAFIAGMLLAHAGTLGLALPPSVVTGATSGILVGALTDMEGVVVVAAPLLVAGLASGRGTIARMLARPRVCELGEWSYALYLIHGVGMLGLWKLAPVDGSALQRGAVVALYALLTLVAAVIGHRYLEVPARRVLAGRSTALVPALLDAAEPLPSRG